MTPKKIQEYQLKTIQEISQFIKNWRINENLSRQQFSSLAGIHVNTIHNLERFGRANLLTILKCIDVMDITVSEFFNGIE